LGQWVDKIAAEHASRALVTRAGFVTSQVMRDLVSTRQRKANETLKSDPTFGLYQLIKTWIDDWLCLSSLRQTVLSAQSASPVEPKPMSVVIPSQNPLDFGDDLSTAMPHLSQRRAQETLDFSNFYIGHN
jgi:hypothetical protein